MRNISTGRARIEIRLEGASESTKVRVSSRFRTVFFFFIIILVTVSDTHDKKNVRFLSLKILSFDAGRWYFFFLFVRLKIASRHS